MRATFLLVSVNVLLVGGIVSVALFWCRLSMLRLFQGPMLFPLWGTHGVHVMDSVVLGVELVFVALLLCSLVWTASYGR